MIGLSRIRESNQEFLSLESEQLRIVLLLICPQSSQAFVAVVGTLESAVYDHRFRSLQKRHIFYVGSLKMLQDELPGSRDLDLYASRH